MSDVVETTVRLVNLLTPGERRGREYAGEPTAQEIAAVLALAGSQYAEHLPDGAETAELRAVTGRLYAVFAAVDAGDLDRACATANEVMAGTRAVPVLSRHGSEPWHLHFHAPDAPWALSWGAAMSTSLATVLGNAAAERLGVCSAGRCDRVFADTSRNGTKRFCSTACQNRAKAAAFRARRREG
ncbi:CGNR zinc finger domain-containing protein [Nocardiopsis potens]|uniref:CGNR zinc finger domain-containing protein n=1 Tax=Nocardiopsis potens TaxID=1246458 RepID=UPI0005926370|nr:CGNR zinc finger domain-containing protein [Nocardiopsis potens]